MYNSPQLNGLYLHRLQQDQRFWKGDISVFKTLFAEHFMNVLFNRDHCMESFSIFKSSGPEVLDPIPKNFPFDTCHCRRENPK